MSVLSRRRPPDHVTAGSQDFGWSNAGWHRAPGTDHSHEVQTPSMDELVRVGIELDRHYVYQFCSPTRCAIQTGRNPLQVNPLNLEPNVANPEDPVGGFAGIARNFTAIGTKMAAAGYRTHFAGKWDAGMATRDHTPRGRGYHTSLHYFHHDNSYWDQHYADESDSCASVDPLPNGHPVDKPGSVGTVVDLWRAADDGTEGPAHGYNNSCDGRFPSNMGDRQKYDQGTTEDYSDWPQDFYSFVTGTGCSPGPLAAAMPDGGYIVSHSGFEDALFEAEVTRVIDQHAVAGNVSTPLFLFWAPHAVHSPLQVPAKYLHRFDSIGPTDNRNHARQIYHAMVGFVDDAVGNVTDRLRTAGLWDETLIVMCSDNGGPIYQNGTSGANNFPLRT